MSGSAEAEAKSGAVRTDQGRPSDAAGGGEASTVPDGPASADTDADGGYVHRPDAAGSPADAEADASDVAATTTGVRGWALVGVVVTCFLVVPGIIYLRPAAPGQLGLSFFVAMLVLPMLPALLLGLTAVWSMRGPREERDER